MPGELPNLSLKGSPNEPLRSNSADVRFVERRSFDLESACENAAESDGEVVVAVREFPSSEYQHLYNRHQISVACARLSMRGYAVDTKTVMDSTCSKLILVVEKDTFCTKTVHAEKLND